MRDLETIAIAIETAETGHLVFGTLHTTTAPAPSTASSTSSRRTSRRRSASCSPNRLKARHRADALPHEGWRGRVAALEILLVTPRPRNLIREGKTFQLPRRCRSARAGAGHDERQPVRAREVGPCGAKEAYVKAVDKVGLQGMFEKEGIKLDVHGA